MTKLYYDNFANEVVTETDETAPPERYIRVHCDRDLFIEKWFVGNNKFLDIAYTQFERKEGLVGLIRRTEAKKRNVSLSYITDWTVPQEHYNKMKAAIGGTND